MDNYIDERDRRLLENDRYTFFVLGRIMGGECRVLLSDHKRVIICHSEHPYPVWIWTPDDASEEEMENIYQAAAEMFPFDEGYTFNMKYELAEHFIRRADREQKKLSVKMNMFAYDCPDPIRPEKAADGKLHPCTMDDIEEIIEISELFQEETGVDRLSYEQNLAKAEYSVKNNSVFFWEDGKGRHVASCSCRPKGDGGLASIGLVYTRKEARRKHYAENLVYQVSKKAGDEGYLPMLYTNADYIASNACYEKVGYVLKGKLCTIGM